MRAGFLIALTVVALSPLPAGAQDTGYMWMLDRRVYTIDDKAHWTALLELERKALDDQAARNGGRVDISYSADRQTLEIVEAATLKADGRVLPVLPDKIFDVAPQVSRQVAHYSQTRTKSIVFPDVAAGDSVRYVYRVAQFESTWPGFSWSLTPYRSVRTKLAEYTFDLPATLHVATESGGVQHRVETSGERVREIFSWSNDKVVPAEAGSTAELDAPDRFSISTLQSYAEIGEHYGKLHAASSAVTPEIATLANEIVGATADRETQARLLYEWVARRVRYVSVSIGSGALTPTPAAETIRNRYGDCKAHVALLAALLGAKGIESVPVLINIASARYVLPDVPVAAFDHVILYLPEFDRYLEPTSNHAAFGVLPWTHYGKPVLHAVVGKPLVSRIPRSRAEDNVGEVFTSAVIDSTGKISGTTRETAKGSIATDLKFHSSGDLDKVKAEAQLRAFGTPGTGKWTTPAREDLAAEVTIGGEFTLVDGIDLASGEALTPSPGLRFLTRPGTFLLGTHDRPRQKPFPCHAGRQIENLEVAIPSDFRPVRLPADRTWQTAIAEYKSSYRFRDGKLLVRREFVARPPNDNEVCTPEQSEELVGLMSNIRRDFRAVVVFDKPL